MKKQLIGLILASFLVINFSLVGGNYNYPVKKVNGIEYYVYIVQASEGLFAIGRKFDLTPDDITKANPDLKNNLKVGQEILIPCPKQLVQEKKNEVIEKKQEKIQNPQVGKVEFIAHKVEKKQTLFAISRKYDVSEEDIIKYNPVVVKGLHEGIVLQIPKQDSIVRKKFLFFNVETTVKKKVIEENKPIQFHKIQANETLYSISRKYNVKVADLILLNPGAETKIEIGDSIRLCSGNVSVTNKLNNEVLKEQDLKILESPKKSSINNTVKIAFLLPFMLEQSKREPNMERFIDFYAGSLMAIEEAKQKGVSFEIFTYDTEKSEEKVTEVLANENLKNVDLIIGPAFSNQVSLVAEYAKENKINTLIPFTSKISDIDTNPFLFQFNPGIDADIKFMTEILTKIYKSIHIVFAEIPEISTADEGKARFDELQKELSKAQRQFSKIELSTSDNSDFKNLFKIGEKYLIVFNTDKYAYVGPFISPLRSLKNADDIILFEQYSWRNQNEKMPINFYSSPFNSTINSDRLNVFNTHFKQYFGKEITKETPRYDLLGYDLSNYFISLLNQFGNKFYNKIDTFNNPNWIQTQLQFNRISNGSGFVNQKLYLGEDK
jgi:LysM repeat protein